MKKNIFLFLVFVLLSCQSNVKKEDLNKLNGYWEIKEAILADGTSKDYKVNETIDYFELKESKGFRQKFMPQFDGRFKTNGIQETIELVESKSLFFIEHTTKYGKWKEQIISIEDSILVLKNKEGIEYTYKKFKPYTFK